METRQIRLQEEDERERWGGRDPESYMSTSLSLLIAIS
jgi:hypothetical protein